MVETQSWRENYWGAPRQGLCARVRRGEELAARIWAGGGALKRSTLVPRREERENPTGGQCGKQRKGPSTYQKRCPRAKKKTVQCGPREAQTAQHLRREEDCPSLDLLGTQHLLCTKCFRPWRVRVTHTSDPALSELAFLEGRRACKIRKRTLALSVALRNQCVVGLELMEPGVSVQTHS